MLGIYMESKNPKKGKEIPAVPAGLATHTFRRDSLWAKFYFWFYKDFPRDLCTYFYRNVVLIIFSVTMVIGCLFTLFLVVTLLALIVVGIFKLILAIPAFVVATLAATWKILIILATEVGRDAASQPFTNQEIREIAGLVLFLFLFFLAVLFFRSTAWKITRLRWKAFKEKNCPLIRFE
ncbi:MAG: hypothetical protein Q7S49_02815 [bacterium]|nr:hypothetical protein [bacterium]